MTHGTDTFLIGTDDGTLFRCFTRPFGKTQEPHWIFQSAAAEYLGPHMACATTLDEVEALVHEWWQARKELGQGHG